MSDREATSELSSSVREGAGYDEVYPLGRELEEDFPQSPEKELSTYSLSDEKENEEEEDEGNVEGDEYDEGEEYEEDREGEEDERNQSKGVESVGQEDGGDHPFILPAIWTVNDFYLTMSNKVFNTLQDRYQIPESIPIRLPGKFKRCYSGKTADVGMYDAMLTTRLRLPLTKLHHQLANYLGLSISKIAPTA